MVRPALVPPWPTFWLYPVSGPPWAVMTARRGSSCCSHQVLMSAGVPARACS